MMRGISGSDVSYGTYGTYVLLHSVPSPPLVTLDGIVPFNRVPPTRANQPLTAVCADKIKPYEP